MDTEAKIAELRALLAVRDSESEFPAVREQARARFARAAVDAAPSLLDALESARKERDARDSLILHMDLHSGYPECGYWQMNTAEKNLFREITGFQP